MRAVLTLTLIMVAIWWTPQTAFSIEEEESCILVEQHDYLSEDVMRWGDDVKAVSRIPQADMLTLIFMESTGNPSARRPGSRFYGLLQISDIYMQDALEHAGLSVQPASTLMGQGRYSIQVFQWYMERYAFLHGWRPEYVAMIHKAGPGGFERIIKRAQNHDMTFEAAVCADQTPGACQFYRRFHEVRAAYQPCFTS